MNLPVHFQQATIRRIKDNEYQATILVEYDEFAGALSVLNPQSIVVFDDTFYGYMEAAQALLSQLGELQ